MGLQSGMIEFEVDQTQLQRIELKLKDMKAKAPQALKNAVNATARDAKKDLADKAKETYMALAGWNVEESTAALTPVLKLAEATQADLATTSDQVTDSMSAMGVGIDDLQGYLDVIVTTRIKPYIHVGRLKKIISKIKRRQNHEGMDQGKMLRGAAGAAACG